MEDSAFSDALTEPQPLEVRVDLVESMGSEKLVHFRLDAVPVDATDPSQIVHESQTSSNCRAVISRRSDIAEGDNVKIAIDAARLHFFDLSTGSTLA